MKKIQNKKARVRAEEAKLKTARMEQLKMEEEYVPNLVADDRDEDLLFD